MSSASKGIASPLAIIILPVGIAAMAAVGAGYGAAAALNHTWAIVNPLLLIIAVFAIGWLMVQTTRLAVLRHAGVATLIAFVAAASVFAADVLAAHAVAMRPPMGIKASMAADAWAYCGERRANGIALAAGHVTVRGWVLVICWVIAGVLVICATQFTAVVESIRPFCPGCRTWGWKTRWRFNVKSPSEGMLQQLEQSKSIAHLFLIQPGSGSAKKLRVRLGACKCGRVATVAADVVKIEPGGESAADSLLEDLPPTPAICRELFAWAESISPAMAQQRPSMQLERRASAPLVTPLRPESGDYISSYRWSGAFGGGLFRADNEYTRELRQRLELGEFEAAENALRAQKHADDLAVVAEACGDWPEPPKWLEDWARERPNSAALHLVRGICFTKWAWVARGSGWKPKDFDTFIERLSMADGFFDAAAVAAPKDPTPWAWKVQTAKGLQLGEAEVRRRLAEAARRWPAHTAAYLFAVDALSPKWGGSAAAMLSVAREGLAAARPGANVCSALADAHLELAFLPEGTPKPVKDSRDYLSNPQVMQELRRANELCFRPGAHVMTMATPRSRVWFAYVLWKAGALEPAAEHLRVIGKSTPYDLFARNLPFAKDTVKRARRECGVS